MLLSQASSQGSARKGAASSRPLSVSEAMQAAKNSLESLTLTLIGEVSEVNAKPGYKAVYFTVKDAGASLPCMMWLNRYHQSGVRLEVGQRVELTGRFTLYAPKGRMNFDVFSVSVAGEGDLRRRVAELARRLEQEGLMDQARKRPVPRMNAHVGLVTSPRGDAVHDVMRTMRRRFPLTKLSVAGVAVEGANAPAGMIEALRACVRAGCEVILLVRGGGSFEDLMPFNDEMLARAIAACPVPVVTGIGHEPDTSIADMVADVRASTPTAAAERVTPEVETVGRELASRQAAMANALERTVGQAQALLERYETRPVFKDPRQLFATDLMTVDMLHERLSRALPASLEKDRAALAEMTARLRRQGAGMFDPFEHALALRAGRLHDLSPLQVLSRGYAMAKDSQGRVVSSVEAVAPGEKIDVSISDGVLRCTVDDIAASHAAE
ncbi:exodeoxyribonuclease VII large subunit [Slackia faecicanis]|uniref:Exodeoxyribonuclease 7 large subunit n=1 Tax=Slackia faecicanis TaxID=255723 RepID=A0A3N0AH71_9ACTN|nr:exodeoxyribonuclease VII large subunit [Slackia faecicanis]MDO5357847.1 exodeoxyribonuclease VII large subunit [Slackia faecicanis]RNL21493.1 exodeoxyribonuclease VII large subunit [Slackia faecicanis]